MAENSFDNLRVLAQKQPLGNFDTRCDDKGRIRIPSDWLHFITHELRDSRVFTTSLEGKVVRIYPESIWRYNLALFEEQSDFSEEVESILTIANHYGVTSDLDANGRVLIKTELRAELGLLGEQVVGTGKKGVIHVHRQTDYAALVGAAKNVTPDAIRNLTKLGMR